jgi:hypothetical protein
MSAPHRDRNASGEYYAKVVRMEGDGFDLETYIDALDAPPLSKWIKNPGAENFLLAAPHSGVVVHTRVHWQESRRLVKTKTGTLEPNRWYRMKLGMSGIEASWAENTNLAVDGGPTYIAEMADPTDMELQALQKLHVIDGASGPSTSPSMPARKPFWVGIMNMGQGSCVAVMSHDDRPVAYIDTGFPVVPKTRNAQRQRWSPISRSSSGFPRERCSNGARE